MKPKLFIGSSKENESVLRQIEKRLNPYFDCVPWTDEVQVKSADCEIAKKKEFNVFFKTLKRLIDADVNCRKHIEIHGVE